MPLVNIIQNSCINKGISHCVFFLFGNYLPQIIDLWRTNVKSHVSYSQGLCLCHLLAFLLILTNQQWSSYSICLLFCRTLLNGTIFGWQRRPMPIQCRIYMLPFIQQYPSTKAPRAYCLLKLFGGKKLFLIVRQPLVSMNSLSVLPMISLQIVSK